jgi:hypothetical protein
MSSSSSSSVALVYGDGSFLMAASDGSAAAVARTCVLLVLSAVVHDLLVSSLKGHALTMAGDGGGARVRTVVTLLACLVSCRVFEGAVPWGSGLLVRRAAR